MKINNYSSVENYIRNKKIFVREFGVFKLNSESKIVEKTFNILGSPVIVHMDNTAENNLLLNNPKFLKNNLINPIIKNWSKILNMASKEYDKYIYEWGLWKNKNEFLNEIKPTSVYISIYKNEINLDLNVTPSSLNNKLGGHDLCVYITNGIIDSSSGLRLEG